ncbi:hypothetical protein Mgra_00006723 [Meloidogyne graminicola]|uniref:Uncharacterized protein n=1 Tax=Meloidogyne graminicola TaxID=189291 RepID=A0A8S9ZL60_9BILA|nr:hypothetical protein Mgra_00006723 [Meloidogyne graminicola]
MSLTTKIIIVYIILILFIQFVDAYSDDGFGYKEENGLVYKMRIRRESDDGIMNIILPILALMLNYYKNKLIYLFLSFLSFFILPSLVFFILLFYNKYVYLLIIFLIIKISKFK